MSEARGLTIARELHQVEHRQLKAKRTIPVDSPFLVGFMGQCLEKTQPKINMIFIVSYAHQLASHIIQTVK